MAFAVSAVFAVQTMHLKAILCDIEGTTTSVEFAQKVLFPISYERMESFIHENCGIDLVRNEIEEVKTRIATAEGKSPDQVTPAEVIATLRSWIEQDKKEGLLKSIQGKIWKESFESGKIKGHVYPDVPECFRQWKQLGLIISIFSSGSIEAQELIFKYSEAGDLTPYLHSYFDTTTGPKKEAASYHTIAVKLSLKTEEILFLSDVTAELDAAQSAGMQTTLLVREGQTPPSNNQHRVATSFHNVILT